MRLRFRASGRYCPHLYACRDQKYGLSLPELDLGGGYGIGYTEADTPRSIEQITVSIADAVASTCERLGMTIPHMSFEPGRSISGPSGMTLYTVGTIKKREY